MDTATKSQPTVTVETSPDRYHHWKLTFDGPIATLGMDVQEDAGLSPDYRLKLNSYDLGVDIELADAIQRLRFEHPEVHTVVISSLTPLLATLPGTGGLTRVVDKRKVRRDPPSQLLSIRPDHFADVRPAGSPRLTSRPARF